MRCKRGLFYFNSKVVRLKASQISPRISRARQNFNSKVVRLKGVEQVSNPTEVFAFQFQSGTIKSARSAWTALWTRNFNSKVVRLKAHHANAGTWKRVLFQFQSGTIKSCWTSYSETSRHVISIPKWYD